MLWVILNAHNVECGDVGGNVTAHNVEKKKIAGSVSARMLDNNLYGYTLDWIVRTSLGFAIQLKMYDLYWDTIERYYSYRTDCYTNFL